MKVPGIRRLATGSALLGLAVLSACAMLDACTVTGGGVDASVGYGYDAGYYEPWGYDYGGWGYGYRVGPGRGGERRGGEQRGEHGGQGGRSYRPAPQSRPTPSIPHSSRGSRH